MYVATRKIKVAGEWREPGDLVPEADSWRHVNAYVERGEIAYVPAWLLPDVQEGKVDALKAIVAATGQQVRPGALIALKQERAGVSSEPDAGVSGETSDGAGELDDASTADDGEGDEPDAEEAPEAAEEAPDDAATDEDYMGDPSTHTVKDVIAYADAHPEHAEMLLDAEVEGKNRPSLVAHLESMLATEE